MNRLNLTEMGSIRFTCGGKKASEASEGNIFKSLAKKIKNYYSEPDNLPHVMLLIAKQDILITNYSLGE